MTARDYIINAIRKIERGDYNTYLKATEQIKAAEYIGEINLEKACEYLELAFMCYNPV